MTLWDIYEKSEVFQQMEGGEMGKESASLFVCGIMLREVFCPGVKLVYPETELTTEQLWYLLCLYHDRRFERHMFWKLAYRRMRMSEKKLQKAVNTKSDRERLLMKCLLSPDFAYGENKIVFSGDVCVKENERANEKMEDLFCFREICSKKGGMDHGIAGGLLLYESLFCKHLIQLERPEIDFLRLGAYLANTLMVHTLMEGKGEADVNQNPLLFLLLLAEAIEPFCYVKDGDKSERLLRSIGMEIGDREIVLRPDAACFPAERYAEHIALAAGKTGVGYHINEKMSEIRLFVTESPIIDE